MNLKYILISLVLSAIFVKFTQKKVKQQIIESDDEEEPDYIEYYTEEPGIYTYISTMVIIGGLTAFFTSIEKPGNGNGTGSSSGSGTRIETSAPRLQKEYIRPGPARF